MTRYYDEQLAGERLRQCYKLAPPRVQRYLESEILHALSRFRPQDRVLELGCGYGRVALRLGGEGREIVGIDVAEESLVLARELAGDRTDCEFLRMDALAMDFEDAAFDAVFCVQNGICAFGVSQVELIEEALRVTRPDGRVILSTYSDAFWPHRLEWFEAQASAGLVGSIDREATRRGLIVCEDGFRSGTLSARQLADLCSSAGVSGEITEVDGSSLFCEIHKR